MRRSRDILAGLGMGENLLPPREIVSLWERGGDPSIARSTLDQKFFQLTKRIARSALERNRNVANVAAPRLVASTPYQEVRMQIHPTSFLLGLGAALVVPLFTRVLRPLAVDAAV